jgi:hypothetical protein
MPHLAVRNAEADHRSSAQAILPPPSRSRFQTRWFLYLLRCSQAMVQEPFFRPRTSFLHGLDHPSLHSSGNRTISSHHLRLDLTSPPASQHQSSGEPCGDLATPLVDGQTS